MYRILRAARITALTGLLAAGLVVVAVPTASAVTITVTTTNDVVNGGDGLTSLREAFATAGSNGTADTIVLGAALTYALTDCGGPLTHADNQELVVQGNGSTIEQTCDATRIIDSTHHDGRLELQQLVIDGGPNAGAVGLEGAAVRSDSELLLQAVEIRNVLSPAGSVVWSSFGHGTTPYRLTLLGSNLHDNTGSVVSCDNCSAKLDGTTISNNTGSGMSLVDGWPVLVENSTLSNNTRNGISNSGQGFAVNKMTVNLTSIGGNGRAGIYCSNCGELSMYSASIYDNGLTAVDARGGISFSASKRGNGSVGINAILSTVTGNKSAEPGGGIALTPALIEPDGSSPQVQLDRVMVDNNQSVGGGGGVWLGFGSAAMYKGSLIGNSTTGGHGGGLGTIDETGPFDLSFDETQITGNSATGDGGGIYAKAITGLFLDRAHLSANTAGGNGGGAKIVNSYSVTLEDHSISDNDAANGAGLDVATENLSSNRVTFAGNQAPAGVGGGVRIAAVQADFRNSTFSGNTATTGGGLAVTNGASATLSHVTMADDQATTGAHIAAVPAAQVKTERSALVLPGVGASCAGIGGAFAGTSLGFSVLRDASCGSTGTDLVTAADPQLGPLGGGTFGQVRVPAATSPLGGRVPVASCTEPQDQLGNARPTGTNCEAGAIEIAEAPPGPDAALQDLIAEVKALNLPPWLENSLVLKLELARVAIKKNQKPAAKVLLTAFIVEVKAQSGKKIPPAAATQLVTKATIIRASL